MKAHVEAFFFFFLNNFKLTEKLQEQFRVS